MPAPTPPAPTPPAPSGSETSGSAPAGGLPDGLAQEKADRLDAAITDLDAGQKGWAALGLRERADLFDELHRCIAQASEHWARTACEIKDIPRKSTYAGEEWLSGPYPALAGAAALSRSLRALADGESPAGDLRFRRAPGGRVRAQILPRDLQESLLLHGFRAEVWMQPGVTADQAVSEAGLGQLTPDRTGGVGLVLGAGNITSIAPLDVFYELVSANRTVLLKLNPIMSRMMPVLDLALAPLIRADLLRIVQGGAAEGEYLTQHPGISHVHITGSAATHDMIVWGAGEDGAARRAAGNPKLTVPITSELGGVSPIIVVPGDWTDADLRFQAEHVATMRLHNSGHNCIAGQVIVLSEEWPQRERFLEEVRGALARTPDRGTWYPRASTRIEAAEDAYPQAQDCGTSDPRLLIELDGAEGDEAALTTEYFAPVLAVVALPGTGRTFLENAARHAHEKLTGTLGANILIDPETRKQIGAGFDEVLETLRYGTIAVNAWTGLGFLTSTASWGAYPGSSLEDVGSGIGVVHNALLLDRVERTVVHGPFRPFPRSLAGGEISLFPKPPWFVTARSAAKTGKLLAEHAAAPSWAKLPGIFAAAFRA